MSPDYSLAVLEVIKHFFDVPRVHFVLGVNLEALQHIVRARYGAGVDAADYLKRFISISMQLPDKIAGHGETRAQIKYFESCAKSMGISQSVIEQATYQITLAAVPSRISLRDIEKILTRIALLPRKKEFSQYLPGWKLIVISMAIFKAVRPDLYDAATSGTLIIDDIERFYGISAEMVNRGAQRSDTYSHVAYVIRGSWQFALSGSVEKESETDEFSRSFDTFGSTEPKRIIANIDRDFFGLFELSE